MAQEDICKIQMKDVRLSYPTLFKARAFGDGDGEPAFSAEFLIPKGTSLGKKIIAMVEDAIEEAKYKKWGDDPKKWPKISKDKPFFKDGDDPDYERPETEDCMIVSARNVKKPRVLGIDKEDLHESDGVIYAGCYVDAIVRVWAQDNKWGKRVNCSLEAVRFRRDGDAFGAAPIDPDEFEDIDEGDDDRRSSKRRSSRDDDDDDRGSSRGSSRRGRDDDEDDRRSSKSRGRSRDDDDEDDDNDDRRSSRSSRSRDDDDDRGSSRRSSRSRDDDDDEDDRRSSKRRSSRDDDDDDDRGSRRRSRDEDDEDRPSRNSRSRRSRDDDNGI